MKITICVFIVFLFSCTKPKDKGVLFVVLNNSSHDIKNTDCQLILQKDTLLFLDSLESNEYKHDFNYIYTFYNIEQGNKNMSIRMNNNKASLDTIYEQSDTTYLFVTFNHVEFDSIAFITSQKLSEFSGDTVSLESKIINNKIYFKAFRGRVKLH